MITYLLLSPELITSITLSCIVLYSLALPLKNVLNRIYPDEQAAIFWLSYTRVMLFIAPLLLVVTCDRFQHFSNPMDSLRLALIAALSGMVVGVHAIGKRLGQFITAPNSVEKTS